MTRLSRATLAILLVLANIQATLARVDWAVPVEVASDRHAVPAAPAAGPERAPFFNLFAVQYRHSLYYQDNSGNLTRATKTERLYNEQNISMRTAKSWNDYLWTSQLAVRRSDDPQVAGLKNHDWDLLSLLTTMAYKDRWDASFGNVMPGYHRYAISSSIEGFIGNVRHTFENKHRLEASASSGRMYRGMDNSRYTRWLTGATAAWNSAPNWFGPLEATSLRWAGSYLDDDPSSIGWTTAPAQAEARAMALRLETRIKGGYTFDADWGGSRGRTDVRTNSRDLAGGAFSSNLAYRKPFSTERVTGWRRALPASWRGSYEIVGTDYYAPQASAGADQMRWGVQADHPFADWMSYNWSYNRSEDNARRLRVLTNYSIAQAHNVSVSPFRSPAVARILGLVEDEMALSAEDLDASDSVLIDTRPFNIWRKLEAPNLRLQLGFRNTGRFRTDRTVEVATEDYSAGASHRMGKWSMGAQFGWSLINDNILAANDRRSENWSATLGRAWDFPKIDLTVQSNAGIRRGYDILRTGVQSNRNQGINAGLSAVWRAVTAGADWSMTRVFRSVTASGSRTHNVRLTLGYRPPSIPSLNVSVSGNLQDVDEDVATQNYRTRDLRVDATYDF